MCLLLVEDEAVVRELLVEALGDAGFAVHGAENGDAATRLLETMVFCLLVTDIHMPGALDGLQLARLMRARCPGIPVIYMTGRPDMIPVAGRLSARDAVLAKPFSSAALIALIRRLSPQAGSCLVGWGNQCSTQGR